MTSIFPQLIEDIRRVYQELGHTKGWRFLTVPQSTFDTPPMLALITLNPGGDGPVPGQGEASCEYGCAYRCESWDWNKPAGESVLQRQVYALLDHVRQRVSPGTPADTFMDRGVLGAYYLPFRSRDLASLVNPKLSLAFARSLWARILSRWAPQLIITIDHQAFAGLQGVLVEQFGMHREFARAFSTGWGRCRADVVRYRTCGRTPTTLLRLPHLSTYKLFSRDKYKSYFNVILDCATAACSAPA